MNEESEANEMATKSPNRNNNELGQYRIQSVTLFMILKGLIMKDRR